MGGVGGWRESQACCIGFAEIGGLCADAGHEGGWGVELVGEPGEAEAGFGVAGEFEDIFRGEPDGVREGVSV